MFDGSVFVAIFIVCFCKSFQMRFSIAPCDMLMTL